MTETKTFRPFYKTSMGEMIHGDSVEILKAQGASTVDLIVTSPPYGLIRPKKYGNVHADVYCAWFKPFAEQFHRVLKDNGSLVIDIGGVWNQGQPTRSLYHFKLLIMLCEDMGFHLAQEIYWYNPSKLPTPTTWVAVRRIRVKDAVNTVWWLSKTPWPKASNRRVLQPYSPCMVREFANGYRRKPRPLSPSGHQVSARFSQNNGAAIPPNLIAISNSRINLSYARHCRERGLPIHPARFPTEVPEYFIRMLTDPGDTVLDPFSGSCTTAEVCQRLNRRWMCIELSKDYLKGAVGRLKDGIPAQTVPKSVGVDRRLGVDRRPKTLPYYHIPKPGFLWDQNQTDSLAQDGGKHIPKALPSYRSNQPSSLENKTMTENKEKSDFF